MNPRIIALLWVALACSWSRAIAASPDQDLTSLSLEQLMNEPVTSVSKKETRIGDSPAAVTVITREDLRRLGITTIPDALRLVPGMDVARISPNEWAISARGFNSEFATKLLVLIDGRTVYSPSSAGVFWNSQDVVLEDVDRIEVIRGPGAALWGANAVDGVINIITRSAQDTRGGFISAGGGSEDRPLLTARYGGGTSDFSWRVFGQYFDVPASADVSGEPRGRWHTAHGGFRMDWNASDHDELTLQGDVYDSDAGTPLDRVSLSPPSTTQVESEDENVGANVLARWTRSLSTGSLSMQTYIDHVDQGNGFGTEHRNTFDLEVQHRFSLGTRQDIVWGLGYRLSAVEEGPSTDISWSPGRVNINLFNLFVQDEITLVPDRLRATVGTKFEHNDLSGWFVDPTVRLLWTPTANQTFWSAVSRASRTPSLFELYGTFSVSAFNTGPNLPPTLVAVLPGPALRAEQMTTYEMGYRFAPVPQASVDLSVFFSHYDNEIAQEPIPSVFAATPAPAYLVVGYMEENADDAKTYGFEASASWQALSSWKLMGGYTWLRLDAPLDTFISRESPTNQLQIRSYADLTRHLEFNTAMYYVGAVESQQIAGLLHIPGYVRADAGLVWKPGESWSLGVWGRDLLDRRHLEFASEASSVAIPIRRSWFAKATWAF